MPEHQMMLEDDDCKQKERNLNVEELMELVRKMIAKVDLVVKVGLVLNLEVIDLTHLKRR